MGVRPDLKHKSKLYSMIEGEMLLIAITRTHKIIIKDCNYQHEHSMKKIQ